MHWLNVPVDVLQRPEFTAAIPAEVGVWLRLASYCAAQENGGIIHSSREWTDRQWLIAAGVTKADVDMPTRLWRWDRVNPHMHVAFYPREKEQEVAAKRKAGKATAARRWASKLAKNGTHKDSSAISSADSSADAEVEGKGMKRK